MYFKENKTVELKEKFSKSLMKTISAYANYNDGKIYVGINDRGEVVGIEDVTAEKLNIENTINDLISPTPFYDINTLQEAGKMILEIIVYKGQDGPYYYKNVAYMRNDTSTLPVDGVNLTRLVLKSRNLTYDQIQVENSELQFDYLEKALSETLKIHKLDKPVLTTIGLLQEGKYNNAAVLLADNGTIEQSFVDIAKFELNIEVFYDRIRINKQSLLKYYDEAIYYFNKYYSPYQIVEGSKRITKNRVPLEAFREALANALVHRDYIVQSGVQISMFENRIEIRSPGGLTEGITEELYFAGLTSVPRNPIISYVFYRLGLIEQFGTGIKRIINSYKKYNTYPSFDISSDQIKIILPVLDFDYTKMNQIEAIIAFLHAFPNSSRSKIEETLKIEKSFAIRRLNELIDEDTVIIEGNGPSTTYRIK